jgi:hypothetical protein
LTLLTILAIAAGVGWLYVGDFRGRHLASAPPTWVGRTRQPCLRHGPAMARRPARQGLGSHGRTFNRARFGESWSDDVNVEFGHNGCNTRDDILRRDLVDLRVRPGTCFAQSGVLHVMQLANLCQLSEMQRMSHAACRHGPRHL